MALSNGVIGLDLPMGFPAEPPVEIASDFYKSSAGACVGSELE